MTAPTQPATTFQAVREVLVETNLFGQRIWAADQIPTVTPTYPFGSIQVFGYAAPIIGFAGDGGGLPFVQQYVQIDIWQENAKKQDPTLPGQVIRALQSRRADVHDSRVQFRFSSAAHVPTPPDETGVHYAITIVVYGTMQSL